MNGGITEEARPPTTRLEMLIDAELVANLEEIRRQADGSLAAQAVTGEGKMFMKIGCFNGMLLGLAIAAHRPLFAAALFNEIGEDDPAFYHVWEHITAEVAERWA